MLRAIVLGMACATALACGPTIVAPPGDGDTDGAGTTSGGSGGGPAGTGALPPDPRGSSSGPAADGTTDPMPPDLGDGDTTVATDETGDLPPPPMSVCDPQPEFEGMYELRLDDLAAVEQPDELMELSVSCTLEGIDAYNGSIVRLALACEDGEHFVSFSYLHFGDPVEVPIDATIELDVITRGGFSPFLFVAIRTETAPLFLGMSSWVMPGATEEGVPDTTFFAPWSVELVSEVCRPEPVREPACDFICTPVCTQDTREALRVATPATPDGVIVHDRTSATIDGTFVRVEAETRLDLGECTHMLPAWYELSAFTPGLQ